MRHKEVKDFKTLLIVPQQVKNFDPNIYRIKNPICPEMIYKCIKRIFRRHVHENLSSKNKPLVVEVILQKVR